MTPPAGVRQRSAETLELRTADGYSLNGWCWRTSATPTACVVLVHGFVGSGRSAAVLAHVEALLAAGYDVVTYDARGHGDSGGACTLGALERHDVAAAVEAARERCDRVVLVGESAGGTAVLGYAAGVPAGALAGIVTVGSPASWAMKFTLRAAAAAALTRTGAGRRLADRWLRVQIHPRWMVTETPATLAAGLEVPLAVVHGNDDPFIPPREARQIHARAGAARRLDVVDGMGHGFGPDSVRPVVAAVGWVLEADAGA